MVSDEESDEESDYVSSGEENEAICCEELAELCSKRDILEIERLYNEQRLPRDPCDGDRLDFNVIFDELGQACLHGHLDLVKCLLKIYGDVGYDFFTDGDRMCSLLYFSCKGGNLDIIHLWIEHEVDLNIGLQGACNGGHRDIIEYMIQKGANDFNCGLLYGTCSGGHLDIAEYMIELGASEFDYGLEGACESGHLDLAEYMIQKGANKFEDALSIALQNRHPRVIKMLSKYTKLEQKHLNFLKIEAHKNLINTERACKDSDVFLDLKVRIFRNLC